MADPAANDQCPETLLRDTVVGGVDNARRSYIITGLRQDSASPSNLLAIVDCDKSVDIFDQEDFGIEMADHLNVAKEQIAKLCVVETRALEFVSGL